MANSTHTSHHGLHSLTRWSVSQQLHWTNNLLSETIRTPLCLYITHRHQHHLYCTCSRNLNVFKRCSCTCTFNNNNNNIDNNEPVLRPWLQDHHHNHLSSSAAWRHISSGAAFLDCTRHYYCYTWVLTPSLSDTLIVLVTYLLRWTGVGFIKKRNYSLSPLPISLLFLRLP